MSKSTRNDRPEKPYDGFPLFPHQNGKWAKKIRGKFHYFTKWRDDWDGAEALKLWIDQRDDLMAGRVPKAKRDELTVGELCNLWLDFKKGRVENNELAERTWEEYCSLCEVVIKVFGRERAASDPGPDDFSKLRETFSKRWGPAKLATAVIMSRSIWNWGYNDGKLKLPAQFGASFVRPSAKTMRIHRNGHGAKLFTAEQMRALLAHASVNMRAMLLLGVQAGIGNSDLASCPKDAVDLEGGWLTLPRKKTGIQRRIPLMPETVEAIRAVLANRKKAKPGCEELLFLTKTGISYLGNSRGTAVWREYQQAAKAAKVEGRTPYDCRRTFCTVADGAKDPVAVQHLMGHSARSGDMQSVYRQAISDDRLQAVVDVVRNWLFGTDGEA